MPGEYPALRARAAAETGASPSAGVPPGGEALWDALRARRRELAEQQGVPPYVIFHDASLVEMVARRPRSLTEFGEIPGVGEKKLERYGEVFLEIIEEHAAA